MSATCWLWFASCQWGIPISLRPPLPFIFLFTIHLTTYRGGRILVISCWIGNLTRSLTSNGDSDPRAFQLTASRGGWRRKRGKGIWNMKFQLTASRGGWLVMATAGCRNHYISTHSLTRRLTFSTMLINSFAIFQLTASRGGWPFTPSSMLLYALFQLTASRGGWRCVLATDAWCIAFQLTASRGGWQQNGLDREFPLTFQLTASRGGWPHFLSELCANSVISTHSLTRRLTIVTTRPWSVEYYFNSQPHEEADSIHSKVYEWI